MWFFVFAKDLTIAHSIFYYSAFFTYAGPLCLQFFPVALMLTCVIIGIKSGFWYDRNHGYLFWLPWFGALFYQVGCIVYLLYAVPAIGVWHQYKDFDLEAEVARAKKEA